MRRAIPLGIRGYASLTARMSGSGGLEFDRRFARTDSTVNAIERPVEREPGATLTGLGNITKRRRIDGSGYWRDYT